MADRREGQVSEAASQAVVAAGERETAGMPWYRGVPRYAWVVLIISALGWLFDTMDQNLFTLVRQPSVKELLEHQALLTHSGLAGQALDDAVKVTGGWITSIFLIGWAIGGFVFGILGDRLGRTRTMMLTICIYALFTGLNGFAQAPWQYALCRFLTALGVGGEFATGAALVAEVWPARSRPMALGMLQALSAVGNIAAAAITFFLASLGWRWAFFIGAAPALLVLWIRASVKEPEKWKEAQSRVSSRELGNITNLFTDPTLRRNTLAGVLLATAGVGGLWGVGFFLSDLNGLVLKPELNALATLAHLSTKEAAAQMARWKSEIFAVQQVGGFLGIVSYALLAVRVGRKPALMLFLALAWIGVVGTFWGVQGLTSAFVLAFMLGFCALAPFSAYAVYFPELYPTRLRATGVGFCYNCARLLAAAAPFALGGLASYFSSKIDPTLGYRMAATIVASVYVLGFVGLYFAPETKGKPLPE